jgi:hypothetical protein
MSGGPAPPVNTVLPSISGTPQQGQTLTASPGTWTGSQPITFSYQWQNNSGAGGSWVNIGTNSNQYLVQAGDVTRNIRVIVTATNGVLPNGVATSNPVGPVTGPPGPSPPVNTVPPAITGATQPGQTLTASPGTWTGSQPITFSYQWQNNSGAGGSWVNIGTNSNQYVVQAGDVTRNIRVIVTATNGVLPNGQATSNPVGPVTNPPSGQISLNGPAVTGAIASGTTVTLPVFATATQPNNLILLEIAQRDESKNTITVTGICPTWNQVANVDNVQGQGGVLLYWAQCPSPAAGQIVVTIASNTLPVAVIAQRFAGVDTTTPVEAVATNAGPAVDDRTMQQAVTTLTPNAWAVAAGWHRTAPFAVPAGETAIQINTAAGSSGDIARASMWYQGPVAVGSTQVGDVNDLSGANDWAEIVVSLKPAP